MIKNKNKFCFTAFALFVIFSGTIPLLLAQENQAPIGFELLLQWISGPTPSNTIKDSILERRIGFQPTVDRMIRIQNEWKKSRYVDLPSDIASLILKSYAALQKAALEIACMKKCELFVDDKKIGEATPTTPFRTSEFEAGPLTVVARADGFKEEHMQINLAAGQLNILAFDEFFPMGGGIQATCDPEDCQIFLNDMPMTLEQLEYPKIAEGLYNIQAKKEGWQSERRKVRVSTGRTTKIHLKLNKILMPLPDVRAVINAILEPFNPNTLDTELNYEAQGEFSFKADQTIISGRIKERVQNDQITWELSPNTGSGYSQIILKYEKYSYPEIAKSDSRDTDFAEKLLPYIERLFFMNPHAVVKRITIGGGYAPRLEWWDKNSMRPFTGPAGKWWEEGSLKLIAEYSDQKSVLKISRTQFDEFPVITELLYTEKGGITTETHRAEFHGYQGMNPFWPNRIILFSSLDSDDGFEIHYDSNYPRSLAAR